MDKVAIIHFSPIELYPPAINDVLILGEKLEGVSITVYTTHDPGTLFTFNPENKKIAVKRIATLTTNKWKRYLGYFFFHLGTTIKLIFLRPSVVLYFETLSAFPAIFYKRYINRKAAIMVHYHEYTPLYEYRDGMTLNRWFHEMEKKLYPAYDWVSHMLQKRMELFLDDHANIKIPNTEIIGNFPPRKWKQPNDKSPEFPLRLIYIGALSRSSMYLEEFAEWVVSNHGKIVCDFYTFNYEAEAYDYLKSLNSPYLNFKNGIRYFDIPGVLKDYHVGVILYKGIIPNHVHSAPNKLFEYLSADLDVWLPETLSGSLPYVTDKTYPKVVALNFQKLAEVDLNLLIDRTGLKYQPSTYYAESELSALSARITAMLKSRSPYNKPVA
jgi:hypothetical protein